MTEVRSQIEDSDQNIRLTGPVINFLLSVFCLLFSVFCLLFSVLCYLCSVLCLLSGDPPLGRFNEIDKIVNFRQMIDFRLGSFNGFIECNAETEKYPIDLF